MNFKYALSRLHIKIGFSIRLAFFLAVWLGAFQPEPRAESPTPLISSGPSIRVTLNRRGSDPREPGPGDFLDCSGPSCQAVLLPRVEADEKLVLPRNKSVDELRFFTLRGLRPMGRDRVLTIALFKTAHGDSVFADLNNDEDLGNDGPARFWPQSDSCVTVDRVGGGMAPLTLCRAADKAKAWEARCEDLKTSIIWAKCDEPPVSVRVQDLAFGAFDEGGKSRLVGLCDLDGDGKFHLSAGDRFLLDWDGDGVLNKSLDADGYAVSAGKNFRFSLDNSTYELKGADENGHWLELQKLSGYDPGAAAAKAVEGRAAPDIHFVNLDGDTLKLSSMKGKKILIHFWSTLCKPCLDQINDIREFQKSFGNKNWQVISMTTETDLTEVQQAVLKYHIDWMVGMAGPEARAYYSTHPLPLTVKINESGILEKQGVPMGKRAF